MKITPRRRLPAITLFTIVSVLFFANSAAHASQPGEGTSWTHETESGHNVFALGAMAETRDPNNNVLVQVWRAANNTIRLSVGHGPEVTMAGATTYADPVVEWVTTNGSSSTFRVFHTGTNGFVFYTYVTAGTSDQTPHVQPEWEQVPHGVATPNTLPVSVVSLPNQSVLMSWRGSSSDEDWSIYFDGTSNSWNYPSTVPGARSESPLHLEMDLSPWNLNWRGTVVGTWLGTDGQVNLIRQTYGQSNWWGHEILSGIRGEGQPAVAIAANGQGQVAVRRAGDHRIALARIDANGGWQGGWDLETTGYVARAINLIAYQTAVYLLATGTSGGVDWKQSRQF
ncbi:hypothetical protein [Kitasatospora sp. NPDC002965]|uniref:hypothetical protein n=1 Tax=Kitasatospora sp. NPDC002965 TaxID=3154775 RepID=UPI0033B5D7EA